MADIALLQLAVSKFKDKKILCIGDLMLDRFVYGDVDRISPEAPIPVLSATHEHICLGAAGNVARNIAALGANVEFYASIGNDHAGNQLQQLLHEEANITSYLTTVRERTTVKTRFISQGQQVLRVDDEEIVKNHDAHPEIDADAIILSDYCKGFIPKQFAIDIIYNARKRGIPVIVDSKSADFAHFDGATVITPNLGELAGAIKEFHQNGTEEEIVSAARQIKVENILVTRASRGMSLISGDDVTHIPAKAREVFDVVGAGDTVAAVLALGLASGLNMYESAYLANIAGGIVVGKRGTAIVTPLELKTRLVESLDCPQ